jgi:pyruvate dehydrogenase E1 component alpha subunit
MGARIKEFPDVFSELNHPDKVNLLRTMVRIRSFEMRVEELFLSKKIPGFVHLYIGEEAIATGIMANLQKTDWITSTHRGHGHAIAKGAQMNRMMAELFGKRIGYCKGKGGSMHIADFSVGMLGANGVVGGGFPIAVGAGITAWMKKTDQLAVCFFGDGASNRGTFHEALNLAALWKLPVLFVNENNQYASTTPVSCGVSASRISDRAVGYGIEGYTIDGNNVIEVYNTAQSLIQRIRSGKGPMLLECRTYRVKGHYVGDPEKYRKKEEVKHQMEVNDPIRRYTTFLLETSVATQKEIDSLWEDAKKEVEEAVQFAEQSPPPSPQEATEDLFAQFSLKEVTE